MINSNMINVRRFESMRIALGAMQRYWYRDHPGTRSEFDQFNGLGSCEILSPWSEDLLGRPVDVVTDKAIRPELRPFMEKEAVDV